MIRAATFKKLQMLLIFDVKKYIFLILRIYIKILFAF